MGKKKTQQEQPLKQTQLEQKQSLPDKILNQTQEIQDENQIKIQKAAEERRLKFKAMKIRSQMGLCMAGVAGFILCLGHLYTCIMCVWALINVFFEILVIKRSTLDEIMGRETILQLIIFKYHFLISFGLVMMLIIWMVFNLIKKGNLQYQVKTWAKSFLLSLMLTYCVCSYIYAIFQGYFWFLFCIIAVIINDVAAYQAGFFFGKTPLIKLSPKKTQEGFIGGVCGSFIICFLMSSYLSEIKWLVCPQPNISFAVFDSLDCEISSTFIHTPREYNFGPFGTHIFNIAPIQFHALTISLFTSLIAPFGGFMASGFKRAFKVKDFADKIPGHGGFTDRLDCKIIVGWFIQFYLSQVVLKEQNTIELAYKQFQNMDEIDKVRFFNVLGQMIHSNTTL